MKDKYRGTTRGSSRDFRSGGYGRQNLTLDKRVNGSLSSVKEYRGTAEGVLVIAEVDVAADKM